MNEQYPLQPNLVDAQYCLECGKLEIAHDDPYAERCEKCFAEHEQNRAERHQERLFTWYWEGVAPDYVYENMARKAR